VIKVAVVWFLMGLLFFYTAAVFKSYDALPNWIYYCWAKFDSVLMWIVVYELCRRDMRKIIFPVLIFSIIRFIWDIVSFFTGVSVNNSSAVGFLFMLLVTVIFYLYLKELIRWQK